MSLTTTESIIYSNLSRRAESVLLYHAPKVRITTAFKAKVILARDDQRWSEVYHRDDLLSRRSTLMQQVRQIIATFAEAHPVEESSGSPAVAQIDLLVRYYNRKYQRFVVTVSGEECRMTATAVLSAKAMREYYRARQGDRRTDPLEFFEGNLISRSPSCILL